MRSDAMRREQLKQAWVKFDTRMKEIRARMRNILHMQEEQEQKLKLRALREDLNK